MKSYKRKLTKGRFESDLSFFVMYNIEKSKGEIQMYGYKINNSYTIYVNYAYLNECKKASDKYREVSSAKVYTKPQPKKEATRVIVPLALKTKVHHK